MGTLDVCTAEVRAGAKRQVGQVSGCLYVAVREHICERSVERSDGAAEPSEANNTWGELARSYSRAFRVRVCPSAPATIACHVVCRPASCRPSKPNSPNLR